MKVIVGQNKESHLVFSCELLGNNASNFIVGQIGPLEGRGHVPEDLRHVLRNVVGTQVHFLKCAVGFVEAPEARRDEFVFAEVDVPQRWQQQKVSVS